MSKNVFDVVQKHGTVSAKSIIESHLNEIYPNGNDNDNTKTAYVAVSRSLNTMARDGDLIKVKTEDGDGRLQSYDLSKNGIEKIIDNLKVSSEEFWELIFSHVNNDVLTSLPQIIYYFEKKILDINRNLIYPYKLRKILYAFKHMSRDELTLFNKLIPAMKILGSNGKVEHNKLRRTIHGDLRWEDIGPYELDPMWFIDTTYNPSPLLTYFNLGKFGLILLMHYYSNEMNLNNANEKKLLKEITTIIGKHRYLFPLIFQNKYWRNLKKWHNIKDILFIFGYLYFARTIPISYLDSEELPLINSQYDMSVSYFIKLKKFYEAGLKTYKQWASKHKMAFPFLNIIVDESPVKSIPAINWRPIYSQSVIKYLFDVTPDDAILISQTANGRYSLTRHTRRVSKISGSWDMDLEQHSFDEIFADKRINQYCDILENLEPIFTEITESIKQGKGFPNLRSIKDRIESLEIFPILKTKTSIIKITKLIDNMLKFKKIKPIYYEILQLEVTLMKSTEDILTPDNFAEYEKIQSEERVQDIISFQFYTVLKYFSKNWNDIIHDQNLSKWYENWLSQIKEFKRKDAENSGSIKVKSSDLEREQMIFPYAVGLI